jgi:hypothetical protein
MSEDPMPWPVKYGFPASWAKINGIMLRLAQDQTNLARFIVSTALKPSL